MAEETSLLASNIIFIILNILFFAAMIFFVARVATGDTAYEQIHAKQIALLIDAARPNTELKLDISKLIYLGRKNKYGPIIRIEDNVVNVKVTEGKGYSFRYFSDYEVDYALDRQNKELVLKIK